MHTTATDRGLINVSADRGGTNGVPADGRAGRDRRGGSGASVTGSRRRVPGTSQSGDECPLGPGPELGGARRRRPRGSGGQLEAAGADRTASGVRGDTYMVVRGEAGADP